MRIEFKVPGAHIIYKCPECKCIDFMQLGGASFACCGCGSYYNDFQQLLDEGGREQLDNAYAELSEELTKRLTERFG